MPLIVLQLGYLALMSLISGAALVGAIKLTLHPTTDQTPEG